MTIDDALASAAVEEIRSGMTVGLGTGHTAARAIQALARRAAAERMSLLCVATSRTSEELARRLGLPLLAMEEVERIDYLFDGADEVDASMRMLKGRGGAMTREKIAAHAAARRVYLAQSAKLVERLGATAPLPIEVMRFGLTATRHALRALGLDGPLRGAGYATDDGNPVIDAVLPAGLDLAPLAAALDETPGVVGHGLFLTEADLVLVEDEEGTVSRRLTRAAAPARAGTPRRR
jgi:ribose 5-phosphate isomerase A